MELDDTELQDYLDTFIACLQDGMFTVDMSREAVQNIVEVISWISIIRKLSILSFITLIKYDARLR